MWPRIIEIVMAVWLAAGSRVLAPESAPTWAATADLACAVFVAAVSLASMLTRLRKLHLINLFAACGVIVLAYVSGSSVADALRQNYMLVGLMLGMFAILPSRASRPPLAWTEFLRNQGGDKEAAR